MTPVTDPDSVLAASIVERAAATAAHERTAGLRTRSKTSLSDVVTNADHAAEELVAALLLLVIGGGAAAYFVVGKEKLFALLKLPAAAPATARLTGASARSVAGGG